jgi:GNAT superfamily N-acetyltransferase
VELRRLATHELVRVEEIDVTEEGEVVYHVRERDLVAEPEPWARTRLEPLLVERLIRYVEAGGVGLGAFEDEHLVGIAVYRPELAEDMGQLAALFVDRDHRRTGIATRLVDEVVRIALAGGAARLYVSATPSESAVGFYRSRGFELAEEVNPELFALEPEDVHMIKRL